MVTAFIAAATINFFLPRLMPCDPIQKMFAGAGSDLSLENLNALKLTFGFIDAPIGEQYLAYLKSVFTGDLGRSVRFFPLPVTELLGRALIWPLGLVGIVVNGLLFWLVSAISGLLGIPFAVDGFWWAVLGALFVGIVSWVLGLVIKDRDD